MSFFENWKLRIHLWLCINCRRFDLQMGLMRYLLRQSGQRADTETAVKPLSVTACERISEALDK